MTRQLATVKIIDKIEPIPGADKIEVAIVGGWHVVVNKNDFEEGELIVFCEIDSLMPLNNPSWAFLEGRSAPKTVNIDGTTYTGYRLKTIRLRGQLSQGLILPLSAIPSTDETLGDLIREGDDVSEVLGIVKWEAVVSAQLAGTVKGNFPSFIHKTDEERVQNYRKIIQNNVGLMAFVTEKLDGMSVTCYKFEGTFGVCSRNLELKETEGNTQWDVVRDLKIEESIPEGYAIQGELVGPSIQGNPLKRSKNELYIFNVYDILEGKYLDFEEMVDFLSYRNIPMVPLVTAQYKLTDNIEELIKSADGMSMLSQESKREGIVVRPLEEIMVGRGNRFSFKVISNEYLLEKDDR